MNATLEKSSQKPGARSQKAADSGPIIEVSEQIICPCDDVRIIRQNTAANIVDNGIRGMLRIVRCKCQACGKFWRLTQAPWDGQWVLKAAEPMTDPAEMAGFQARLDFINGDRQSDRVIEQAMDDINDGGDANPAQHSTDC